MPSTTATARPMTVEVDGATIAATLRGDGPLIALHAAPMDSRSFEGLAEVLAADWTVLTADPRGVARSTVADRTAHVTPDQRAADLAAVLQEVDAGPATVVGSSGGAVSALALAATRPELLEVVVAHEPPLCVLLPDARDLRVGTEEMVRRFTAGDREGYWRLFLDQANIHVPDEVFAGVFGQEPEGRDAEDEAFGVENMLVETSFWEPPLDRLRSCGVPIVVGIGEESTSELCDRTSRRLAEELGLGPTMFPGGHIGFTDHPDAFASVLRAVGRSGRND